MGRAVLFGFVLILVLVGSVIAIGSSTGSNTGVVDRDVVDSDVDGVLECVKCGGDCVVKDSSVAIDCVKSTKEFTCMSDGDGCVVREIVRKGSCVKCGNSCVVKDSSVVIYCAETTEEFRCLYNGLDCEIIDSEIIDSDGVCGNGICEEGEANINDLGGCGPDADPECLGPPARFIEGSCPKDCGAKVKVKEGFYQKCEDHNGRRDRIKCRLDYVKEKKKEYVVPKESVPEACRNLEKNDREGCRVFYKKSYQCFEKNGRGKNKCFKRLANFAKAKLKDEKPEVRDGKARDYVVLLLYDIQEKIEHAIENERVGSEKGAEVIDKIVVIKELILKGEKKNVVKPLMRDLRVMLQEIRDEVDKDE
jgi:hypothetical protein